MTNAILAGGIVPRPITQRARKNLLEVIIPEWKKESEERNRVLEMATFGSPDGSLFLCLVLKEFSDEEALCIHQEKNSTKILNQEEPFLKQHVSDSRLSQAQADWEILCETAYQTYVQILDDQMMIILIHDYPLRKV